MTERLDQMQTTGVPGDSLLTHSEVAEFLKIKITTLYNWLSSPDNDFPEGMKLGTGPRAQRRWWRSDIVRYLYRDMKTNPTDQDEIH